MSTVNTGPDIEVVWRHQFINANVSGALTGFTINLHSSLLAIVTSITLSNISGVSGDVCGVFDANTNAIIFQALRGDQVDTSFVWQGQWSDQGLGGVDVTCTGSSAWSVQASGFYQPNYFSRFA